MGLRWEVQEWFAPALRSNFTVTVCVVVFVGPHCFVAVFDRHRRRTSTVDDDDKCNKTKFIKTVIGDVVAHLKPQKFAVSFRFIATMPVAFYRACSNDTVHYKFDETVNFCGFRCASTSPITVYKLYFFISIVQIHSRVFAPGMCAKKGTLKVTEMLYQLFAGNSPPNQIELKLAYE